MSSSEFDFFAAAIIPALVAFGFNVLARGRDILKSSGADFLLLVFTFDFSSMVEAGSVSSYVHYQFFRANFIVVLLIALCFSLLFWYLIVHRLEPSYDATKAPLSLRGYLAFGFGWALVISDLASHIYLFTH